MIYMKWMTGGMKRIWTGFVGSFSRFKIVVVVVSCMDSLVKTQFDSFVSVYGAGVAVSNSDAVVHVCETMSEFDELVEWIENASTDEYESLVAGEE